MKKLLNISFIFILLINISCVKIKNEIADTKTYDLDGNWELYDGNSDIKRISFKENKVILKTKHETIQGKLGIYKESTSTTDLYVFTNMVTKKFPAIEYYDHEEKIRLPILYETIDEEAFITLNDDVYQKVN